MKTIPKKNSSPLLSFGKTGSKYGEFHSPCGIREDINGNLLIIDEFNHRIQKFSPSGEFILAFGRKGKKKGEFFYPTSLTIDKTNDIYISDRWNHRIQKFSPSGEFILAFGSYGNKPGEFNEPWGLEIDDKQDLYIADNSNHRIQKFSSTGEFIWAFGKGGANKHFYQGRSFKNSFIYQQWLSSLNKFQTIETLFYQTGYELGVFEYPQAIRIIPDQRILIADTGNHRLLFLSSQGKIISGIGSKEKININLYRPSNIYVHSNGSYYILLEIENKILIISPTGETLEIFFFAEGNINNFYLNAKDEIFIADSQNDKIWKFKNLKEE